MRNQPQFQLKAGHPRQPPPNSKVVFAVLRGENPDGLNPKQKELVKFRADQLNGNGEVIDEWKKSPLRFKEPLAGQKILRIYSVGKNGMDENGQGDDQVYGQPAGLW